MVACHGANNAQWDDQDDRNASSEHQKLQSVLFHVILTHNGASGNHFARAPAAIAKETAKTARYHHAGTSGYILIKRL